MNLVIEEINRAKKVIQRQRFRDSSVISIGRALDNDIVLNEPHVSPYHAQLKQDSDGNWQIFDLDSVNGVRTQKRKAIESGSHVRSGDTFLLGRSYISIWDEQHPVDDAWPLHSIEDFFHQISSFFAVSSLFLVYVIGEWYFTSAQQYVDVANARKINELFYQLVIVLAWSSLWSLSGRILRHESRFLSHLAVSLIAAMLFQWLPALLSILAYNGLFGLWLTEVRYFVNGVILSLLLWSNFYLSLPQTSTSRVVWSNSIAWILVLLFILPPLFDTDRYRGYPRYDGVLLAPSVYWSDASDHAAFIKKTESLYQQVAAEQLSEQVSANDGKDAEPANQSQ
ncbi:MAG: FHA domain-containing protein [Kangiellaceae bacterium]|jgi:hypothetical protein|nr:FHA domain-containing protein [Kangiellaceae bacterium]